MLCEDILPKQDPKPLTWSTRYFRPSKAQNTTVKGFKSFHHLRPIKYLQKLALQLVYKLRPQVVEIFSLPASSAHEKDHQFGASCGFATVIIWNAFGIESFSGNVGSRGMKQEWESLCKKKVVFWRMKHYLKLENWTYLSNSSFFARQRPTFDVSLGRIH